MMTRQIITLSDGKSRAALRFGRHDIEDKAPGKHTRANGLFAYEYGFNWDDLPVADVDGLVLRIPANAVIKRSYMRVHDTFLDGTSLDFGLAEPDGTVIDADGIDATVGVGVLTENAYISFGGALINSAIGGAEAQLQVVATGVFTAGRATVVIEIEDLRDRVGVQV